MKPTRVHSYARAARPSLTRTAPPPLHSLQCHGRHRRRGRQMGEGVLAWGEESVLGWRGVRANGAKGALAGNVRVTGFATRTRAYAECPLHDVRARSRTPPRAPLGVASGGRGRRGCCSCGRSGCFGRGGVGLACVLASMWQRTPEPLAPRTMSCCSLTLCSGPTHAPPPPHGCITGVQLTSLAPKLL